MILEQGARKERIKIAETTQKVENLRYKTIEIPKITKGIAGDSSELIENQRLQAHFLWQHNLRFLARVVSNVSRFLTILKSTPAPEPAEDSSSTMERADCP